MCSLFLSGPGREHADAAWSIDGMRQWHKMTSRGTKKKGKLAEHFGSKSHKAALADFYAFSQESLNVDLLLDKEKRSNAIQAEKDKLTNKDAVFILLDIACTLARQGIAFRGRSTNSTHKQDEEDGNFNQIVQLLSRHCPGLNRWLNEVRLRPYHVTYMSHDSQNEYDFASNMSGIHNGAQAEIEKKLDRKVPYIPCQAHRCNTVVEHGCESSHIIQELFNILQELYVFFSGSTKRHAVIAKQVKHLEQVENCLQLRNLSKTRWTARAESIKAVWTSLEAIIKALEEAFAAPKLDAKVKATISGLLKNVKSFDFIVSLMFMKNIMFKTKILSEILQQEELNIVDALELTKATVTYLERINNEETEMNDMIEAAVLYAKTSLQIDAKEEFTRSHRVRRIPRRYDENPQETTAFTFYQYYRKEFKCVLDVLISQFRDKI